MDWIIKERTILMNKEARMFIKNIFVVNGSNLGFDDKFIRKFNRDKIVLNNDELELLYEALGDVLYDYKDDERDFIEGLLCNLN